MIWEAMQGFGALVGTITAAFVIWERFYRYTPAAYIVAEPVIPGGRQMGASLRIINRSERPIIVSWPNGDQPNTMQIAQSSSLTDVADAIAPGMTAKPVDGKQNILLPVLKPDNWASIDEDGTIEIVLTWRFVQPQILKMDRSIRVSITKRSWKTIVNETDD